MTATETKTKQFLNISDKVEVDSYPYGRLRATAFFSIEFDKKKGFRSVFQTIDPKSGRLNNPKKSTYTELMCQYKEAETGHIKTASMNIYSDKLVNASLQFLIDYQEKVQFTEEMINYIIETCVSSLVGNSRYFPCKDENRAQYIDIVKNGIKALNEAKTTKNYEAAMVNYELIETFRKS